MQLLTETYLEPNQTFVKKVFVKAVMAKSCFFFSQKRTIVDASPDSKYVSDANVVLVLTAITQVIRESLKQRH